MKCIYTEKLVLTKEEVSILDNARKLLDAILMAAMKDGDIEGLSRVALDHINELLSDDYSDMEG